MIIRECNHCGRCCHEELCAIAQVYLEEDNNVQACPALVRAGDDYLCGLYLEPEKFVPTTWLDGLSDDVLETAKHSYFSQIKDLFESTFRNECDSVFGQGKDDLRIPIHLV